MTKYETMSASVLKHVSKRDYIHKQWVERQAKFKCIVAQDSYGVQKKILDYKDKTKGNK